MFAWLTCRNGRVNVQSPVLAVQGQRVSACRTLLTSVPGQRGPVARWPPDEAREGTAGASNAQQVGQPPGLQRAGTTTGARGYLAFSAGDAIVHNRGIAAQELARYLRPSLNAAGNPMLLLGMASAVERLLRARQERETVAVYGDFDVDGMTATAVLVEALRACGLRQSPIFRNGRSMALVCLPRHRPNWHRRVWP